jgi:hypothetical protein
MGDVAVRGDALASLIRLKIGPVRQRTSLDDLSTSKSE